MGTLFSVPDPVAFDRPDLSSPVLSKRPAEKGSEPRKRRRQSEQYNPRHRTRISTDMPSQLPKATLPSNPSSDTRAVKPGGKPTDEESDREEDIRGVITDDAPVKPEHILRAVRNENGVLSIDTGGRPLYSETFFHHIGKKARVYGASDSRAARLDGNSNQSNFLDFQLRKCLRKRQVPLERSRQTASIWSDAAFRDGRLGALTDREKPKIDMRGKVYVAPLTTVGNLPFRRLCKQLGADITCGEMALAGNLLQGQNSEWALLRRHKSEDLFGVQLAGSNVDTVTRAAELIGRECKVDFIELNAGCPIDLVFNKGGGCSLMRRRPKLQKMVWSMAQVVDVPVGVKVRTGVSQKSRNAHEIIYDVAKAGAGWVTVHGRSRKQRYSKLADWGYITRECGPAARQAGIPLLGNGDVYNWRDAVRYWSGGECENTGVQSVMVARGGLIKPWLLTEIKERRDWDIRSTERLELYKDFTRFGLEHWGGDAKGVETTRRFLLEWLSFLYRYVPVGILEREKEHVITMSHRAPLFRGRDELETLLGSRQAGDWIRITEMLLGKVPDGFRFRPKHVSNAWGDSSGAGASARTEPDANG